MPIKNVTLMLCTNDEDGVGTGIISAVELHHSNKQIIRVDCFDPYGGIRYHYRHSTCLQLGRLRLNILSSHDWCGNMVWSAVTLRYREAKRALIYLWHTGKFEFDSGLAKAADWWDGMANVRKLKNLRTTNATSGAIACPSEH